MESTRKGLRSGALEKDNYGRLNCTDCSAELTTQNNPEEIGKVRVCPECGQEWQEVG